VALQQRRDLRRRQPVQRQQHHHRSRRLPPPAAQASLQPLDLASWTVGEHADRAHTDHDLAGWMDDGGNLDPTAGEADVNGRLPGNSHPR